MPAASQQPEAIKEPEQAGEQEQKKKKKKKMKPPEDGSFKHYEAQSNGGTAIGSSDPSLQVGSLSFTEQHYVTLTVCLPACFSVISQSDEEDFNSLKMCIIGSIYT